jgi:acetyl-CoA synthetase
MSHPPINNESLLFSPSLDFVQQANLQGWPDYQKWTQAFENDFEGTWRQLALEHLVWKKPFQSVLNETQAPFFKWFEDGVLNASYNCLDRHVAQGRGKKIALTFESDDGQVKQVSYQELLSLVSQLANGLRQQGIKKGDRVIIYLPMSVECVAAVQACARIGAIHSVVFAGFSAKSLRDRIIDIGANLIITADGQYRGGKNIPLKPVVDEALTDSQTLCVKKVIVYQRTQDPIIWFNHRDIWLHELINNQPTFCEPEWVEAEHPLFVLYTSGSTGTPKGIQHSTGGYLLWTTLMMKWVFDLKTTDQFWCTADIGWITGHSFVCYGPLSAGASEVIFEGIPTYPDASRFWRMIEKHQVTTFYSSPTAIRSLVKASSQDPSAHPQHFNMPSLRLLACAGEPISPETWLWFYEHVGKSRCPIMDTFWQTETGGPMISPLPGVTDLIPGSCTLPLPGIMAAIVDETGSELPKGQGGLLVVKRPWPSMIRNIWNNPDRFKNGYFPADLGGKLYLAGDGAIQDQKTGYFRITGRIDDVLNVSGHRIGTMEIESSLVSNSKIAEAAVVGCPDEVTGEAIVAFVVLKGSYPPEHQQKDLEKELKAWVAKQLGAIFKLKEIRFGEALPKTRSGKIMRRLLRSIARGEPITQDISTLENPQVLEQLKRPQ